MTAMNAISEQRKARARKTAVQALTIALKELNAVILAARDVGVKVAVVLIDYPDAHGLASLAIQETKDTDAYTIGPRPRKETP